MARPVTLFTGQWADLTLEQLAAKVGEWEFDGLELACWGDHFDVAEALSDSSYCAGRREILERHGLNCWAIGAHLVGQAVCDPIDARHEGVLPPEVWGDGDPEGVRGRAADLVRAAGAGLCIEPESAHELVAAIERLASDPALRAALGRSGCQYIWRYFDRDDLSRRYVQVMRETVRIARRLE